jgi:cytochrome c nitrite reductase small subunit
MIKLKRILTVFRPPKEWRILVTLLLGIFIGVILFILHAARATSYLSDDPKACVNCHVMAPQYATWERGSHGKVTNCNDCHVPQDNFVNKYLFKASDGLRHSFMFTFRLEPQVIQIKEAGKKAVQQNCIRCHSMLFIRFIKAIATNNDEEADIAGIVIERLSWQIKSPSSTPYARVLFLLQ